MEGFDRGGSPPFAMDLAARAWRLFLVEMKMLTSPKGSAITKLPQGGISNDVA
jgi:hypothetical protein